MKDAHQKLTKKFVYSLPEGTILLSTIHFPFGFLSWEIKDYYRSLWEEIKSFGADQKMALTFKNKEDYEAGIKEILESVGQNLTFCKQNWGDEVTI
jgi:hypothetical protein|tara:strand:- start:2450 stop:2737 length:288 start_codon:yes stop_codon:yes gene_type:complete